jgi:hypothetical protein
MLFGGNTVGGARSDTLTSLWIFDSTTVFWERVTPNAGPTPSGRSHFGAAIDLNSQWLVISGGEISADTASAETWAFDLTCPSGNCTPTGHWERLQDLHLPVRANSAAMIGPEPAFPRLPEVFDPATGHWTTLSNSPHWQEWFSFGFLAPRGPSGDELRLFYAGPEFPSPTLHLNHGTPDWTQLAGQGSNPANPGNFPAGSAVMYEPGKIMKCGTRDTGGAAASDVFGRTAKIDLAASSPAWSEAAPADQMISRRNHNLVTLPTGEVLVVGGAKFGGNDDSNDSNCVRMPQIWNPDTLTAGHWYGQEVDDKFMRFDSSTVRRHYHASAILLPDARVLVAGGNNDVTQQVLADIYSPYYLFRGSTDTAATRPVIVSTPTHVAYGECFMLCMSAADSSLSKVSLVRPGATTHGFDQNQRFMTLSCTTMTALPSGERRFLVTAPADSFTAPPGDYMLFALNAAGTPSIAKWIQVRRSNFDTDRPTRVTDLALVFDSYSSADQGVTIHWTPPSADSTTCRGPAAEYQIRYRYSGMDGWSEFAASTLAPSPPTPGAPWDGSQSQSYRLTGLSDGVDVHVRLVSKNNALCSGSGKWSAMSNELVFSTPSSGGDEGGGGGDPILPHAVAGQASAMAPTDDAIVTSTFVQNSLLTNAPPGVVQTDRLPLPGGPHWVGDHAQVKVSRWAVDPWFSRREAHRAGSRARRRVLGGRDPDGRHVQTSRLGPRRGWCRLRARHGRGYPYESQKGDVISVAPVAGTSVLMLRTSGGGPVGEGVSTGIGIQVPDQGGWYEVASVVPRELESEAAVSVPTAASYRLVFRATIDSMVWVPSRRRRALRARKPSARPQPRIPRAAMSWRRSRRMGP